jgi:FkbM family methyltransferase
MPLQVLESVIKALRPVQFRGKARLLNALIADCGVKPAVVFGSRFELDLADFIQRQIYLGTAEPHETRLVKDYLRPGMTFVDAGANVGYYTALAAMLVGSEGSVVAFEPSAYAFERLQALVARNGLAHVKAVHAGLSDAPGSQKLYLGIGSHNHAPTMVPHDNASASEVLVTTLDDQAARLGIERIDLIKMDVEGYEPKVLTGARRLLREGRIRAILCEFNEHWLRKAGSDPQALERVICNAGLLEVTHKKPGGRFENRFFRLP